MKRIIPIAILICLILSQPTTYSADGDLWDNFGDTNIYGTKGAVSDEDFEKALDSKLKKKKPKQMKGESRQESNETEIINQIPKELPVVCISAPIKISDNIILPVGHYQVTSSKSGGKIYIQLYQSHYKMAEFEAIETLDDFDEETVHFANFICDKDNQHKLIYGTIEYNAYVPVEVTEEE